MKKNVLIFAVLVLIAGAAYFFFAKLATPQDLLGQDVKVYSYTTNGQSTGQLSISVPFNKASDEAFVVDIAIDTDKNGQIAESEWQVKDAGAHLVQNLKNNFWLTNDGKNLAPDDKVLLLVHLKKADGEAEPGKLEKTVTIEAFEIGDKFGFDVAGAHEDIKRGIGLPWPIVSEARADGEPVFRDAMTPDLAQNHMECAAVSAANNLMSLAGENDKLDNLPQFTGDLIEELKTDLRFNNGISLANMVAGKNAFTQRHNLPISTELKTAPTKEDILNALNS
ncbi:MAG: hypothetical protein Q8R08_01740, partial [bacterium]|nr:hypothetical protein [bacterium]